MKFNFLLLFVLFSVNLKAQMTTFQLKDFYTQEPIPFAKINLPLGEKPVLADIDGFFSLSLPNSVSLDTAQIGIRAFGFRDTTFTYAYLRSNLILLLKPAMLQFQEVVILPGENPAHRIMNQVISNRKKNNPTENGSFQYDAYSKFHFTLDPDALQKLKNLPVDKRDSNDLSMIEFFETRHLFLIESESRRKFSPPARDKEEILAYKVSGFNDPMFSTFAQEMQSFSFYENQFSVLGKNYINPIALGGINRYLFILEDTTLRGKDTVYTISFRPRKGKNFNGLKGQLYINTNGFAIEKVVAEPMEEDQTTSVKIVQEYAFLEDKRWFPIKLNSELRMSGLELSDNVKETAIIGKGSTYLHDIQFDTEFKRSEFSNGIAVETAADAGTKSDQSWDSLRLFSLSEADQKTYVFIDSLSKANNLDKFLALSKVLASGKIPMGNFNLDLRRLLQYNLYEGYRFGLGLETSEKLMKRVTIGGYGAWATKDKAWKYGAFGEVLLHRKKEIKFRTSFHDDLVERGGIQWRTPPSAINSNQVYRQLYVRNFDRQRLAEAQLSGYFFRNIRTTFFGNYQRIQFLENYQYADLVDQTNFDVSEAGVELSWQMRDRVSMLGNTRVSLGSKYPRIQLRYAKGITGIGEANWSYDRFYAEISQQIPVLALGKFMWMAQVSGNSSDIPLVFNQIVSGTGGNWRLSVPNTFETILPGTFYSDRQAAVYTRFTFNAIKSKFKWMKPQIGLHHAIGIGEMTNRNKHSMAFQTMEKGYCETGIIIDKLLISNFSGFGIGVFMPYGAYAVPQLEKNITMKLSLSFDF